jgi:hypothetical protein
MKLWLDDQYDERKGWFSTEWQHCRWPTEVIEKIKAGGVTHVSLDHDIGDVTFRDEDRKEITGNDVVTWVEEQVKLHGLVPPELSIHSANSEGRRRMQAGIDQIAKILAERE